MSWFLTIIIIFTPWKFFHISVSWCSFTGVWVTTSLLRSLGFFSVLWPMSTLLLFGLSPRVLLFLSPLVLLPILWSTIPRVPLTISTTVTFMDHRFFNSLGRTRYLSFFSQSFNFIQWSSGTAKSTRLQFLFFFIDYYKAQSSSQDLVIWLYVKIPVELVWLILLDRFSEFFTPVLADRFPRECWIINITVVIITLFQVFHTSVSRCFLTGIWVISSLLMLPGIFSVFRPISCCNLDGLYSSLYFKVLQSLYQFFGCSTKSTNYNWYHRHFHVPKFFLIP